ncbi:Suppressor of Profilin deletion [Vermiconidia calcicola]|uniref:Suppressor of Profilin deletion n=1 Tax=Vermiconidia calcicola TaxID=1690605 RepID=A0ACC3N941_9PEZI|nr:Suppressor of Profilin deletion [Vermiconidia calcicola]
MAMERQDYPAMLPQLQPPQAVEILNYRVQQVGKLNVQIADWLQVGATSNARRRDTDGEARNGGTWRSSTQLVCGSSRASSWTPAILGGVFSVPWTTLTGSADTLADSHSSLATKIEVDVERPLREFTSTNREMTQMSTVQGNLAAMAKEVERAQDKTDKLRGKGDKADAGKVASANSEADTAQTQWESQAPYIFESLQAMDEVRLDHLRNVLTQFQTHEVDQVERTRITAEQCLNVLLNVETADEIKTFALKALQTKPSLGRNTKRNSIATPSRSFQGAAPGSSSSNLTPTVSQPDDELTPVPEDKHKGRLNPLRRLGTVMGRRRESKMPSTLPSTSESPERKQRPSALSSFSSRLGRSRDNTPTLDSLQEQPSRERPRSPQRLGSDLFETRSKGSVERPSQAPRSSSLEPPHVNGTALSALTAGAPPPIAIPNGSHQGDLADLDPPKPIQPEFPSQPRATDTPKDSEGFSVPPQDLDPISQAQRDAALEGGAPQYNVNIRDAPIQDDGGNPDAALADVATKLQAPPTLGRRAGTVRGRRDNRNSTIAGSPYAPAEESISESAPDAATPITKQAEEPGLMQTTAPAVQPPTDITDRAPEQLQTDTFIPPGQVAASTFSPFTPQAEQQIPSPLRPESRAATGLDHTRNDSQSIRSATTTGSQAGAKHPDLLDSGLSASIVENVSARFENGKLVSSSMIGEIALAYNPANFSSPFGNENIRLQNFSSLEKVAPNPAFVSQSSETEGGYSINLSNLSKTQIAFKYQVRVDNSGSQAPLIVAPAFRPEANQMSIIVSYSLNPTFALNGRESITLSNVTLGLTLEGAKALKCLSKPAGTFAREKNLIFWQLNDITLRPNAAPNKLLARFTTESEASSGTVEAKWELTGENVQGFGSGITVTMPGQSGAGGGSNPFDDEDGQASSWKAVPGVKKLASGSYLAK